MDVSSLSSVLVVYGPLGVMAAAGLYWKYQADQRAERHESALQEQATEFGKQVAALQEAHREEVVKLTDRFVALVTTYGDQYRQLLDKVSTVVEALTRRMR